MMEKKRRNVGTCDEKQVNSQNVENIGKRVLNNEKSGELSM